MRSAGFISVAVLGVLALFSPGVRADTVTTYNFSGTLSGFFDGSDAVTGQFTLDATTGKITAFNFTTPSVDINTMGGWSAFVNSYTPAASPDADFVLLSFIEQFGVEMYLWFQTDLSTFSGSSFYPGFVRSAVGDFGSDSGLFCAAVPPCPAPVGDVSAFMSGGAVAAPEPSSLLLVGSGLLALLPLVRRHARPLGAG